MSNYIGAECPVCKTKFAGGDDIVVCPVCGTPHHRKCYQENGRCAFEEQHTSGHIWENPNKEAQPEGDGEVVCPSCQTKNPANGIFCRSCGAALNRQPSAEQAPPPLGGMPGGGQGIPNAFTMACGGMSPAEQVDGISVRELAYYVGPNSHYYLPRFKQISSGNSFSVNFSAFIFNFFYFFYRKMYVPGLLFLSLILIIYIPTLLIMPQWAAYFVEHLPEMMAGATPAAPFILTDLQWVANVLPYQRFAILAVSLACAMFGNQIYCRHAARSIRKIKEQSAQDPEAVYIQRLMQKGHTNFLLVLVLAVGLIALYFGITWLSLFPYWDTVYSIVAGYIGAA